MLLDIPIQQPDAAGWVGPTVAVSIALIAAGVVMLVVALIIAARRLAESARQVTATVERLEADVIPTMRAVRDLVEEGRTVTGALGREAKSVVRTSKRLRKRVRRGADRLAERLEDLDDLYGVVYDEVEDSALGIAATLRTARRARGLLSPLARMWRRRR